MQKPSRFLRLLGVAGLLVTLFAATFVPTAAQPNPDPDPGQGASLVDDPGLTDLQNSIYYPWVANDNEFGLGPADTSITIQNLEALDTYIYIYKGTGDGWALETTAYLAPWASKTFAAGDLNIEAGTGVPVAVSSWRGDTCITDIGGPGDWELYAGRDINGNGECSDYEVLVTLFDELPSDLQVDVCAVQTADGLPAPVWLREGETVQPASSHSSLQQSDPLPPFNSYYTWDEIEDLELLHDRGYAFGGLNNDGDCSDAEAGTVLVQGIIGGVAKTAVDGETLPYTTVSDTAVSGYNAINGWELFRFQQWYLPIVQTNCGPGGCWDTVIRAANYTGTNTAITLRFFPSDDGSGSLNTGFQLEYLVNGGATVSVNLSDHVPEGWVGSVHAYSDGAMMVMADRFKVGYNMWLTNTGSGADFENIAQEPGALGQYVLFAPDVRVDYFGWNTGINIANLYEGDNNVTVQYFNLFGNATGTQTQRLAAHGMTYFYDPSIAGQDDSSQNPESDVNANVIGSALIWSDQPVAVAVDATKYPESTTELDSEVFQGTTYSATANVYKWQSVPLVQKGNPATGMGATSGINMMNPNSVAAQALVYWINQSGFGADNFGTSALAIPAYANGFVYTLAQHNIPNGFYGAALVTATYPIVATSANVDYQVQYDGSVIWNAFNSCGFYRTPGPFDCYFGDPFAQPEGGSVKKIFYNEFDEPVEGAYASLMNATAYQRYHLGNADYPGIPWVAEGISDHNGEVTWTNVPEGNYFLFADPQTTWLLNEQDLPVFAPLGDDPEHEFTLMTGEDLVFENELFYIRASKTVYTAMPGIEVCVFGEAEGEGGAFDPEGDAQIECKLTDAEGDTAFDNLPQGWYWVTVNAGIANSADPGFTPIFDGPEYFEWGGAYVNDYTVLPVGWGELDKTFEFPVPGQGESYSNLEMWVGIFCLELVPGCDPAGEDQIFDGGPDTFPLDGDINLLLQLPAGAYELCYAGTIDLETAAGAVITYGFANCETITIVEGETLELINLVELEAVDGRFDALVNSTVADSIYEVCALGVIAVFEVVLDCQQIVGADTPVQASFPGLDGLTYRLRVRDLGTDCVTLSEPIPYTVTGDAADGFIDDELELLPPSGTPDGEVMAPQCGVILPGIFTVQVEIACDFDFTPPLPAATEAGSESVCDSGDTVEASLIDIWLPGGVTPVATYDLDASGQAAVSLPPGDYEIYAYYTTDDLFESYLGGPEPVTVVSGANSDVVIVAF